MAKTKNKNRLGRGVTVNRNKAPLLDRDGLSPELKHYTIGSNLVSLDTDPSSTGPARFKIETFNNIAQGDAGDGRNGNKIQLKQIQLRIKVAVDPNSDASNANIVADAHTFRVILFHDNAPNGASPTWDTMFDPYPVNAGQEYDYLNTYMVDRFKILADKFITVPPSFVTYDGTNFHSYGNHKFMKLTIPIEVPVWFSDSTNNMAAIQRNNIGAWITSDSSAAARTYMKFSYRARVRYHDY